jgi:hypothetical protein
MSDISAASSYFHDKKCDNNGFSPILLIFLLLFLGGGDNCFLGGMTGNKDCGCNNGGLDGILPLILLLCLCGGSF